VTQGQARARLIVMRHAQAGAGGVRDHDRPLTPAGLDDAHRVGRRLAREGPIPDRILCSSARRCRETGAAVIAGLGASPRVEHVDALYDASVEGLLHAIAGVDESEVLMLIAHNPGVSLLTIELASAREADRARVGGGFSPATTACFDVEADWSLISPRTVRLFRFERPPSPESASRD